MGLLRPKDINPRFLLYAYLGPQFQSEIAHRTVHGATVDRIPLNELGDWPLSVPERPTQDAIAELLGSLDDKIDLNRRMNEVLEETARAIFRSWFLDFDPVRAKMEGRDAALPAELAVLFPNRLAESEIGEIPEGWSAVALDQMGRFLNGLALQRFPPEDGESLPVIKIAQLRAGSVEGADRASAKLDPNYVIEDGDILFSWSGSLECVFWTGGNGALNQHLFKVTSERYPRWLLYLGIHQHLDGFRQIASGKATTMGHIQRHHLSEAKIAVPPDNVLRAFDEVLSPLTESIWRRRLESRTLADIRKQLLPKLISGEIQIEAAREAVGAHS
jgi:type I restriction enzyme S subunit